ncbi:tetratricopeptide repeat protein [Pseudoalteromonas viridis]|uniref:Tetratricopeptide repeat protein n=1 Tax=Pseudoalteromonas viridis TaxID=339617 RepID=A0ABX7VAI9_9GAMM|nr:tetratricopeptide repeat protein [Pseudoalteromonas viridis]QTL37949.1 tetratricopeptide repeat protein [Pseudoalteromonas viridis]
MAERSVSVQGSANQSIIITGDHNQVGGAAQFRIPLVRHHAPARRRRGPQTPPNVLDILSAHNKALSLQGREPELTILNEWLSDDTDISVFAITASAGSGKTRLAIELCEQAELQTGWAAGFVRSDDLEQLAHAFKFAQANWSHSLLLVVDYAGANAQALAQWLDALSQLDDLADGIRVRILLLEREASKEAGWWHTLTGSALGSDQARLDLFTRFEPYALTGLSDIAVRRAVLCAALNAVQALVPYPQVSAIPEAGEQPDFDTALADPQFGNPLALVMAGILCRDMSPRAALSLHYLAAAEKLAQREIDRFYKCFGEGADATKLAHCLCFHLLCGGLRIADMRQTLSAELVAMGWHSPGLDKELQALKQAFPPAEGGDETARLSTTQPDLIAEAMCIQLLQSDEELSLKAADILARVLKYGQDQAAATLVRLLQDFACPVSQPTAQLLKWAEQLVENNQHNRELIELLNGAMPLSSIALAEVACKLATLRYQQEQTKAESQLSEADLARLAMSLNNLAVRQSDLGQREVALASATEAVEHYSALAENRPDAFLPDLAVSLNTLATLQSSLGQHEAAHTSALEAVEHFRILAKARPDIFLPALAGSLNNLANRQSKLGQYEAAYTSALEAVELRRALAQARPDAFLPDLAGSLSNLANLQSALGQHEAAHTPALEAVELQRALAQAHPDAFLPDFAMSLNNLANLQSALGQHEAAHTSALEVFEHFRILAKARPGAFLPDLAGSLNNLANRQSKLGQHEAAHESTLEAVEYYRALAQARPEAFSPYLATSLNNLANLQSALGQHEAAHTSALEAVELRRALAQARPDAFLPDLAMSLNNLANRQSALGQHEAAYTSALEAVELRRALAQARPDAFLPDLAGSLNNLANRQSELGQHEAAHISALEAVELQRALAQARPDAFLPDLASSLNNLADIQSDLGQCEVALLSSKEAVQLLSPYFIKWPEAYKSWMGIVLGNYLRYCKAAEQEPDSELVDPIIEKLNELEQE